MSPASPRHQAAAASSSLIFPGLNASSLRGAAATRARRLVASSSRLICHRRRRDFRWVMGRVGLYRMVGRWRHGRSSGQLACLDLLFHVSFTFIPGEKAAQAFCSSVSVVVKRDGMNDDMEMKIRIQSSSWSRIYIYIYISISQRMHASQNENMRYNNRSINLPSFLLPKKRQISGKKSCFRDLPSPPLSSLFLSITHIFPVCIDWGKWGGTPL